MLEQFGTYHFNLIKLSGTLWQAQSILWHGWRGAWPGIVWLSRGDCTDCDPWSLRDWAVDQRFQPALQFSSNDTCAGVSMRAIRSLARLVWPILFYFLQHLIYVAVEMVSQTLLHWNTKVQRFLWVPRWPWNSFRGVGTDPMQRRAIGLPWSDWKKRKSCLEEWGTWRAMSQPSLLKSAPTRNCQETPTYVTAALTWRKANWIEAERKVYLEFVSRFLVEICLAVHWLGQCGRKWRGRDLIQVILWPYLTSACSNGREQAN